MDADSNYKLSTSLNMQHITVNKVKNDITLNIPAGGTSGSGSSGTTSAATANHYFTMDEKAHCDEKWQDWFCIQNYHNGNLVNKYPNTKTMSVGVCYNSCPPGYIRSATNKCIIYYDDDDLNFNPLAIIAMLGTYLQSKTDSTSIPYTTKSIEHYNIINDTIGMRGSYLNDLYRLNIKEGTGISNTQIAYINNALKSEDMTSVENALKTAPQQKLLLKIIKYFVENTNSSNTIKAIKGDIKKAADELFDMFITRLKGDDEEKEILLNKIKNYVFNIEKLKKLYGKDSKDNISPRFQNIILYGYNIMRFVFYNNVTNVVYDSATIDNNIKRLLEYNSLTSKGDAEDTGFLIKIFKYACYNCFNTNYDIFKKYIDKGNVLPASTVICIINDSPTYTEKTRKDFVRFELADGETTFLDAKVDNIVFTYTYPYYNSISFYDHQLLAEYSENTQYISKILIVFGILLGIIPAVCILYYLLRIITYATSFDIITKTIFFINYCCLFYNSWTFAMIQVFAYIYYYLIYSLSKSNYTIVSVFFKLINIAVMIVLMVIAFIFILELLNIDYVALLKNMNYFNNANGNVDRDSEDERISTLLLYVVSLYLIGIYMYCVYIIRISITDVEYNILANVDADANSSLDYINNLLLQKYIDNITSSFNFVYSTAEINKAKELSKSVKPVITPVMPLVMTPVITPVMPPDVPSIIDVAAVAAVADSTNPLTSILQPGIVSNADEAIGDIREAFGRGNRSLFDNDGELIEPLTSNDSLSSHRKMLADNGLEEVDGWVREIAPPNKPRR